MTMHHTDTGSVLRIDAAQRAAQARREAAEKPAACRTPTPEEIAEHDGAWRVRYANGCEAVLEYRGAWDRSHPYRPAAVEWTRVVTP